MSGEPGAAALERALRDGWMAMQRLADDPPADLVPAVRDSYPARTDASDGQSRKMLAWLLGRLPGADAEQLLRQLLARSSGAEAADLLRAAAERRTAVPVGDLRRLLADGTARGAAIDASGFSAPRGEPLYGLGSDCGTCETTLRLIGWPARLAAARSARLREALADVPALTPELVDAAAPLLGGLRSGDYLAVLVDLDLRRVGEAEAARSWWWRRHARRGRDGGTGDPDEAGAPEESGDRVEPGDPEEPGNRAESDGDAEVSAQWPGADRWRTVGVRARTGHAGSRS